MKMTKKELKRDINKNGFFISMPMKVELNVPREFKNDVPEGATYFEGIASNGDINRNGYIIRETAWKNAISGYMKNPIILLQHNMDTPIGQCLWAELTPKGLQIGGYIYDQYTENKFSKGLFRALSTGHYELGVEFENDKTGEVIDEAEFKRRFGWDIPADWTLAVTDLEWVEFSLVSIGSNRASLITKTNAINNYFMKKNNDDSINEVELTAKVDETPPETPVEEVKPETEAEPTPEDVPEDQPVEEEVVAEIVPEEPKEEPQAEIEPVVEPEAKPEPDEAVTNAFKELLTVADNQAKEIISLENKVEELNKELTQLKLPCKRGLSKVAEKKDCALASLLDAKGINYNS